MSKITFTNKVDSLINSAPAINKIVAADMNEIKTSVNALYDDVPKYKVYTALLNQSGTGAPVATVLENTLGITPVWQYGYVGFYTATNILFNQTKTWVQIQSVLNASGPVVAGCGSYDNLVYVQVAIGGSLTNDYLTDTAIEIRVYN